jgi:hypothetical protein
MKNPLHYEQRGLAPCTNELPAFARALRRRLAALNDKVDQIREWSAPKDSYEMRTQRAQIEAVLAAKQQLEWEIRRIS